LLLAALGGLGATARSGAAQGTSRYFPETRHVVKGVFLQYWTEHGGLAQQGYPLTDEFTEQSPLDGKRYTVQYFERAVFEHHPEFAGTPYEVLLAQLGKYELDRRYPNGSNPAAAPVAPPSPAPTASPVPPTAPPTATPRPATATPAVSGKLDKLQSVDYRDSIGSVWSVGVVQNNTGAPLGGVQITATLLDRNGQALATEKTDSYSNSYLIAPGEIVPVRFEFINAPANGASVRWETAPVPYDPTAERDKTFYRSFRITDLRWQAPGGGNPFWRLVGRVTNTGTATAQFITLHAAAYDAGGALLDVEEDSPSPKTLAPGESASFTLEFLRQTMQPTQQTVFVEGRIK
jgi:hypothetical protein